MIRQLLESYHIGRRLGNSYLINTDDTNKALLELNQFIMEKLLARGEEHQVLEQGVGIAQNPKQYKDSNITIADHPDYLRIEKADDKSRNISIEQIRLMQSFLYKTSVISGKKVAVIYDADQMNQSAANSCLKILEDTPRNTYIFLITSKAAAILPTICSRCIKISKYYSACPDFVIDDKFLKLLDKDILAEEKIKFITESALRDRNAWIEFSTSLEKLIVKFCKHVAGADTELSPKEMKILKQLGSDSLNYLQIKYDKIRKVIYDTNIYDTDVRASYLILIDKFRY